MFTIRAAHLEAFEVAKLPEERSDFVKHFQEFAPLYASTMSDVEKESFIDHVLERAVARKFTYRTVIRFYLEVCVLLGIDFESDPQYGWLAEPLSDESLPTQEERADLCWEYLCDYLDSAAGEDFKAYSDALRRLSFMTLDTISAAPEKNSVEWLSEQLEYLHPEKSDYLGEDVLRELLDIARAKCDVYKIETSIGPRFLVIVMVFLGHSFIEDPLLPWVSQLLRGISDLSPMERLSRLYSRMTTYLAAHLNNVEG